jgi:hypothetical protein
MKALLLAALIAALATEAYADSASHDWNASAGFSSDSANANRFNAAEELYLLNSGAASATYNVTNNTTNTTNCTTETACMYGGSVSNLNGVSVTTVEHASGITVDNGISTSGTQQSGSAVPVAADQIGKFIFN